MRVLVVEDEKKTASFVRKALQAESFAVDVCHNGDDALAAAQPRRSMASCSTSCCPGATA
jgi:DNA-binding response OmpR family regulator